MPIIKIVGTDSVLQLQLEHPIHLDDDTNYKIALVGFFSDNNVNNLREEDSIYFIDSTNEKPPADPNLIKKLSFPRGYYTLNEIEKTCREFLRVDFKSKVNIDSFLVKKMDCKVLICSPLRFYIGPRLSKLLGYQPPQQPPSNIEAYNQANKNTIGSSNVDLRVVNMIELHCNIVENSYVKHDTHSHKHAETEILYVFSPSSPHGYSMSVVPTERHYVPLKRGLKTIQRIVVYICDQENTPIQNENTTTTIYLDLRKF